MQTLKYLIISSRPRQWLKNFVVFSAIVFSGELFEADKLFPVINIFIIFSILVSGLYIINDLMDRKKDQLHHLKKYRPVAAGLVSKNTALISASLAIFLGLYLSLLISDTLFGISLLFVLVQLFYTTYLKKIIILDVITIATTFMIRVFAGSIVVATSLSSWLILTTMMLALFLAVGKRRLELTLMGPQAPSHRDILSHYPTLLLDGYTFIMATATLLTYSLFTFNETHVNSGKRLVLEFLPPTISSPKWLMASIPLVVYGVFRYLYILYEKREGEAPERVLLSDIPLLVTVFLWVLIILLVIYAPQIGG